MNLSLEWIPMISKKVGKIIRIIWNKETDSVQLVMEIIDQQYKSRIIHNKDLEDIITFEGKDVMVIASKSRKE